MTTGEINIIGGMDTAAFVALQAYQQAQLELQRAQLDLQRATYENINLPAAELKRRTDELQARLDRARLVFDQRKEEATQATDRWKAKKEKQAQMYAAIGAWDPTFADETMGKPFAADENVPDLAATSTAPPGVRPPPAPLPGSPPGGGPPQPVPGPSGPVPTARPPAPAAGPSGATPAPGPSLLPPIASTPGGGTRTGFQPGHDWNQDDTFQPPAGIDPSLLPPSATTPANPFPPGLDPNLTADRPTPPPTPPPAGLDPSLLEPPAPAPVRNVNVPPGAQLDENGNLVAMQYGGVVTRPTAALIGESGPEAVVPLRRTSQGQSGAWGQQQDQGTDWASRGGSRQASQGWGQQQGRPQQANLWQGERQGRPTDQGWGQSGAWGQQPQGGQVRASVMPESQGNTGWMARNQAFLAGGSPAASTGGLNTPAWRPPGNPYGNVPGAAGDVQPGPYAGQGPNPYSGQVQTLYNPITGTQWYNDVNQRRQDLDEWQARQNLSLQQGSLTGRYGGEETLAGRGMTLNERQVGAGITGYDEYGRPTMGREAQEFGQGVQAGALTGYFGGNATAAERQAAWGRGMGEQQFGLSRQQAEAAALGRWGGESTLAGRQQSEAERMAAWQREQQRGTAIGNIGGQETLEAQLGRGQLGLSREQAAWQQERERAGLTGRFGQEETLAGRQQSETERRGEQAWQAQQAGLTGYFGNNATAAERQAGWARGMGERTQGEAERRALQEEALRRGEAIGNIGGQETLGGRRLGLEGELGRGRLGLERETAAQGWQARQAELLGEMGGRETLGGRRLGLESELGRRSQTLAEQQAERQWQFQQAQMAANPANYAVLAALRGQQSGSGSGAGGVSGLGGTTPNPYGIGASPANRVGPQAYDRMRPDERVAFGSTVVAGGQSVGDYEQQLNRQRPNQRGGYGGARWR